MNRNIASIATFVYFLFLTGCLALGVFCECWWPFQEMVVLGGIILAGTIILTVATRIARVVYTPPQPVAGTTQTWWEQNHVRIAITAGAAFGLLLILSMIFWALPKVTEKAMKKVAPCVTTSAPCTATQSVVLKRGVPFTIEIPYLKGVKYQIEGDVKYEIKTSYYGTPAETVVVERKGRVSEPCEGGGFLKEKASTVTYTLLDPEVESVILNYSFHDAGRGPCHQ